MSMNPPSVNPQINWRASYQNPPDAQLRQMKSAAQEFEGIFLQQMLSALDSTVDRSNSLFGDSQAEKTFRGMMNEQMAKEWAMRPGGSSIGLAEQVYRQMLANPPAQDALQTGLTEIRNDAGKAYEQAKTEMPLP